MTELMRADIFFGVTTMFVILIGTGVVIALYYVLKILREAKELSRRIHDEGMVALDEVERLGHSGTIVQTLIKSLVGGIAKGFKRKKN